MERVYDLYDAKGKKLESILDSRDCVFDIFKRLTKDEKTYMSVNGAVGSGKTYFLDWFVSYLKANLDVRVVVLSERVNTGRNFVRSDGLFDDFDEFISYLLVLKMRGNDFPEGRKRLYVIVDGFDFNSYQLELFNKLLNYFVSESFIHSLVVSTWKKDVLDFNENDFLKYRLLINRIKKVRSIFD
ncbi:hypothetical protein [uncultured Streptococcus sp.]|uniref:hypothetical protein n=1 Tax=uncultured Streptococcus sp. TaxID=83427 RepID=UPI0025FC7E1A|nr:hypothetical protein [uncultured Streptococcus sp.]